MAEDLDKPEPTTEPHLEKDVVAFLTPVPNGKVLAAYCALAGVDAEVIESAGGTFALLKDGSPKAAEIAARTMSTLVKNLPLLAMERRAGQISIHQWNAGEQGASLPPGLALDKAPTAITRLMTGVVTIDEVREAHPDTVYSSAMGRLKAVRELRKAAKQVKNQQRGD